MSYARKRPPAGQVTCYITENRPRGRLGRTRTERANLDARRAPDRWLSAQNVTCHQGPKLGPSERGYMQITEFEPLSHHRKLPNLGLHRMRDPKRLFGGPRTIVSLVIIYNDRCLQPIEGLHGCAAYRASGLAFTDSQGTTLLRRLHA